MASYRWKGVALPWGSSISSFLEVKSDDKILVSSLIFILLTQKGERVMLPEFGSDVAGALFEPADSTAVVTLEADMRDIIATWDDRIELVDFAFEIDGSNIHIKSVWKDVYDTFGKGDVLNETEFTVPLEAFGGL